MSPIWLSSAKAPPARRPPVFAVDLSLYPIIGAIRRLPNLNCTNYRFAGMKTSSC